MREAGWKEVKLSVISEVKPTLVSSPKPGEAPEIRVLLTQHSYQAGLWNADELGQHQYLEGVRRLSSVNDGAPWIERVTTSNHPQAIQILDGSHAKERFWKVAKAAFGEGSLASQQWLETQAECLWDGRVKEVVSALQALDWNQISCLDDVRQSPAYFRQAGYPIASGTVESGINTVIHHRMKRQGRGWKRKQAQARLAALGEFHSGRFQSAWQAGLSVST